MIFPVILLAIGIFYIYAKIGLLDTTLGLVLAHSSLAVPIVLILMLASLKNFDFNQEKAARVLGATRFKAFCTVTFPQIRRSEEHTSELQSLMRISYAVFCLKTKNHTQ